MRGAVGSKREVFSPDLKGVRVQIWNCPSPDPLFPLVTFRTSDVPSLHVPVSPDPNPSSASKPLFLSIPRMRIFNPLCAAFLTWKQPYLHHKRSTAVSLAGVATYCVFGFKSCRRNTSHIKSLSSRAQQLQCTYVNANLKSQPPPTA